jgi:hypothetical protein
MFGWGKKPQPKTILAEPVACPHEKATKSFEIIVLGSKFSIEPPAPHCPECAEKYLNETSTLCGQCQEPIVPGTPVAQNATDTAKKNPYTHMYRSCCPSGGLFCGLWGNGRLISLHELDPNKYGRATATVAEQVLRTGKMVIESPDRFMK